MTETETTQNEGLPELGAVLVEFEDTIAQGSIRGKFYHTSREIHYVVTAKGILAVNTLDLETQASSFASLRILGFLQSQGVPANSPVAFAQFDVDSLYLHTPQPDLRGVYTSSLPRTSPSVNYHRR